MRASERRVSCADCEFGQNARHVGDFNVKLNLFSIPDDLFIHDIQVSPSLLAVRVAELRAVGPVAGIAIHALDVARRRTL